MVKLLFDLIVFATIITLLSSFILYKTKDDKDFKGFKQKISNFLDFLK